MNIDQNFQEPEGHSTKVMALTLVAEALKLDVIELLEQLWMGDIIYDEDIELYTDALKEFGVDLEEELRSRGMEDPFAAKKARLIKDRGDIGEVLGYLRETKVRRIPPDDMFAPLLWAKLKGGLTTHGIDGIGFIWGSGSDSDRMILCEWKHTAQTGSIKSPCSSASDAWVGLTPRKLLQEVKRISRIYTDRSQQEPARRLKWFAHKWLQQDSSVLCVTMVVHPDITSISQARQDIRSHLVKRCADHESNPVGPDMHECNLLPLSDLEGFLDNCYEEFLCGS